VIPAAVATKAADIRTNSKRHGSGESSQTLPWAEKNDFIIFRVGLRYSSTQATDATRPISTYTCADSKTEVDIRKMPIAE